MVLAQEPAAERPRERLYWNGPEALADAELLAIQLGSGVRGKSATEVAREMLAAYGSLGRRGAARDRGAHETPRRRTGQGRAAGRRVRADPAAAGEDSRRSRDPVGPRRGLRGVRAAD